MEGEEKLEANPIGHLFEIYVEINRASAPEEKEIKEKQEQLKQLEERKGDTTELEKEIKDLQAKSLNEKARNYFKKLEDGDQTAYKTWKTISRLEC